MSFIASIQANIDNFQRNIDRAQARLDVFSQEVGERVAKIGSTFQTIGGALSLGITAPLTAAGVAAYNMAADFEDALGAVDQIFKSASESTKNWANSLPTYYGIAEKEALEYSNMMGSMLKNIGGLTDQEASKQSAKLIELAGDLTAMYGGTTQDAVRALTGALKGNNTMLDNYGMAANDALVKAKALSMGLVDQGKEMTLSAKQAATLALIYEQSGAAQGQAAREAEGASGSMRAFITEISNLTTELGNNLLPIITPIITRLKEMVAGFRAMSPESQKLIVMIGGVAAAIGPLLVGLGSILKLAPLVGTAFSVITGPIGLAVAAIAAAVVLIIKNWDSIREYFTNGNGSKVWSNISTAAQDLWSKLVNIFSQVRDFIILIWDRIGSNVMSIVGNTFNTILTVIEGVINHIAGVIKVFSALLSGDFSGALKAVGELFNNIFETIKKVGINTIANLSQSIAGFLKLVGADGLGASLENWANSIIPVKEESVKLAESTDNASIAVDKQVVSLNTVVPALDGAAKSTRNYKNELVDLFANWGYYDYQVKSLSNQFNSIRDTAKKAGASIKELATIAREELGEKLSLALNQFDLKEIGSGLTGLSGTITIPTVIKADADFTALNDKLSNVKSTMEGLVIDLSSTVGSGISDMASSIGEALASGENVFSAIGDSLIKGLGSLAKSIGEQMIAFGVAGIALKKLMMNPYLAVAAGAALVALGSLASSSIGAQTSSYNGGYASSNYSSSNNNTQDYSQFRGALYNNDKQVVELKLRNGDLTEAIKIGNQRNNRLN